MADISKITLPDNTTYNIKDNNARNFTNTPYYEQDEEALMFQLGDSYMTGEQDNQPYLFRAAGGSAEIGNREYDKIVGGTVAWNQLVRGEASTNEIDFADIVTVDDAVEDAAAVKVAIEPVQDLHGYDAPWPAGGSANLLGGKKLAENINEVCYATWDKAEKTISVAANAQKLQNDRDCFFSTGVTFEENTQYTLIIAGTASGFANVMFRYTDGTDDRQLNRGIVVGVNVSLAGKTVEGVVYRSYSGRTTFNYENCGLFKGSVTAADFVPYSNICPITGWTAAQIVVSPTTDVEDGQTYSITLPTEAGAVYGGELTVNEDGSGSLVVNRAYYDGSTWTQYKASNGYKAYQSVILPLAKNSNDTYNNPISNTIGVFGNFSSSNMTKNIIQPPRDSSQRAYMSLKDDLDPTGIDLSYLIATPVTYSFTAAQIRTLLGQNNVWADTGDLALTYTGTDEHLTLESGRKYLTRISGTDSMLLGSGQEITVEKGTNNVFDITQMFGTSIADYIYSLETATPGAGVAWFRKLFPKPYYEYNPGELMSVQAVAHKLVGFNAWDEEWQLGIINTTTGEEIDSSSNIRSKNYIHVIPGATYYFKLGTTDISNNVVFYDAEKNYMTTLGEHVDNTFTVPENAHYMKFYMSTNYGSTYLSNICINLSGNGERDGEYEEYKMHSYPLDSSLILRGIPKLDANNQLYYDGDVYESDGTVTRKYGIVDLGTLDWTYQERYNRFYSPSKNNEKANSKNVLCLKFPNKYSSTNTDCVFIDNFGRIFIKTLDYTDAAAFKAAMSGVYLVYELATPTTETAEPYDNPQIVDPEGTEEYITTNIVFVGHETRY